MRKDRKEKEEGKKRVNFILCPFALGQEVGENMLVRERKEEDGKKSSLLLDGLVEH